MSTNPARSESPKIETLRSGIATIVGTDFQQLVRTDLKEISFEESQDVFDQIKGFFEKFQKVPLDHLPSQCIEEAIEQTERLLSPLQEIRLLRISDGDLCSRRNNLAGVIQENWKQAYQILVIHLNLIPNVDPQTTLKFWNETFKGCVLNLEEQRDENLKHSKSALMEMDKALQAVKDKAAEIGVVEHARYFGDEADHFRKNGYIWLAAIILLGLVIAGYAICLLKYNPISGKDSLELVSHLLPRVLFISVLSFALAWCAKNYSSSRHNYVINRHRRNALSTFQIFTSATHDPQTKDAVLMQATKSIFDQQPSGYLRNEPDSAQGSQIIEIVKGIQKKD
jgi:hypothetical protein